MAVLVQTIATVHQFVPYERPPDALTLWSAIPRGMLTLLVPFTEVIDKVSPDQLIIQMTGTLPPNFGYVMNDANWTLSDATARAFDYDPLVTLNLQNFYRGSDVADAVSANYVQTSEVHTLDSFTRSMSQNRPWPTFPMIGIPGTSGVLINFSVYNDVSTTTTSGFVSGWLSFWQFDLEQIRKFPINSPFPVHSR